MRNFPLSQIAKILKDPLTSQYQVSSYEIDSRKVLPGAIYFALSGKRADGHQFLREAAEKGAVAAVVKRGYRGEDHGLSLIRVEEPLHALIELAKELVQREKLFVIGITGSVGKTTTKEFVYTLLSCRKNIHRSRGNQNTEIGVPLSILNREKTDRTLILEMGISKKGDMQKLVEIAPPTIAALTWVSLAHTYFLTGGEEEIFQEKSKIFTSQTEKKIVPLEWDRLSDGITFSMHDIHADYCLEKKGNLFSVKEKKKSSSFFFLPFAQTHFQHDFLAAVSIAREYGLSWEEIIKQIPKLQLPKQRFELIEKEGVLFINDAYNAAPIAMEKALLSLREMAKKNRAVAVLGDMRELGPYSIEAHKNIAAIAGEYCDSIFFLGDGWSNCFEKKKKKDIFFCSSVEEIGQILFPRLQKNDHVLLKGARFWALENLLDSK